jgi:hypothetical protein
MPLFYSKKEMFWLPKHPCLWQNALQAILILSFINRFVFINVSVMVKCSVFLKSASNFQRGLVKEVRA